MPESKFKSAAILGSGSFGTALAKLLAPKMETILLIGRDCVTADSINLYHRNPHYLSNIQLQDNVRASIETNDALAYSLIIFAVPTSSTRSGMQAFQRKPITHGDSTFLRERHRKIHW